MVKKVRFPLSLKNGIEVRTIEDFRTYFDLEKVIEYFSNGKLYTWLKDRYFDEEAEKIKELKIENEKFCEVLCNVLGVNYENTEQASIEEVAVRADRIKKLKGFTDDYNFIKCVDEVAFNQEELYDLLDNDISIIYLCGDRFTIPVNKNNIKYVGINKPTVVINSKKEIVWSERKIEFVNIEFDEEYKKFTSKNEKEEMKYSNCRYKVVVEATKLYPNDNAGWDEFFDRAMSEGFIRGAAIRWRVRKDDHGEVSLMDDTGKRYYLVYVMYKVFSDGSKEMFFDKPLAVTGFAAGNNVIFYLIHDIDDKDKIYSVNFDGSDNKCIFVANEGILPTIDRVIGSYSDKCYFVYSKSAHDIEIYNIGLTGFGIEKCTTISYNNYFHNEPFENAMIKDKYLYYISEDGARSPKRVYRIDLEIGTSTKVLGDGIENFTIYDEYFIYVNSQRHGSTDHANVLFISLLDGSNAIEIDVSCYQHISHLKVDNGFLKYEILGAYGKIVETKAIELISLKEKVEQGA